MAQWAVHRVDSPSRAVALADQLLDPARSKPVVVVSIPSGRGEPWIDAGRVANEVGELGDIYLIPTGDVSWAFAERLPAKMEVYGGAGRVYPVGLGWTSSPYESPLRFTYSELDGPKATNELITDALRMAAAAGLLDVPSDRTRDVEATVIGVLPPSRAVVRTPEGQASIWQELTLPAVPLERVLKNGMRVWGRLDKQHGRLDLRPFLPSAAERLSGYDVGDVILAQVDEVSHDKATLLPHPDAPVVIPGTAVTGNPHDSLTSLLTPGEVLVARVVAFEEGVPRLTLLDIDDEEEPVVALSLLPGGPPWLELLPSPAPPPAGQAPRRDQPLAEPPAVPPETRPSPALLASRTAGAPRTSVPTRPDRPPAGVVRDLALALDTERARTRQLEADKDRLEKLARDLRFELDSLRAHVSAVETDLAESEADRARQRTNYRKADQQRQRLDKELKAARARETDARDSDDGYLDPKEQFRHDVYMAWYRRIPKTEKAQRPLREYVIGPDFLRSLDSTEGIDRGKVVGVVVEIVTGLAEQLDGRGLHQLRESSVGGSRPVVRADGAICWRVALQREAASARRLHFWRNGQTIELSRVVVHDDNTP